MFESVDPLVLERYIKNYGDEVNPLVDHPWTLQLEGSRQNICGSHFTWSRIANPAAAKV